MRVQLISKEGSRGRGFLGKFKALSPVIKENLVVHLEPNSSTLLTSLNFPFPPPSQVNLTTVLTTPPNYIISLEIRGVVSQNCHFKATSYLLIYDPYVGTNGTSWIVCDPKAFPFGQTENGRETDGLAETSGYAFGQSDDVLVTSRNVRRAAASTTTFHSTFNRLEITQVYRSQGSRTKWNAEVRTSLDENFRAKVLSGGDRLLLLDACTPNPCLNGGKCVTDGDRHICKCALPYTGPFCGLSVCDLSPCLFGDCVVEDTSYQCHCYIGYAGDNCDRRAKPCNRDGREDKCNGHGECVEVNDTTYKCLCHAFWEGPRCEGRIQNFPFRPLSERMLRDPFWLGIITVTVVLGVIGLAWCLKRHFPEKLEKFLNDDLDKNRRISWGGGCSYHGVRDAAMAGSSQQATSPQTARSFLGRFAIRKPSLLSLSSATSVSAATTSPHTYENRTFSLDDLLRPSRSSMMRTPSPHRRRNFSIHSRREMPSSEKQQILQQLISSGASMSLDGGESKPSTPKPTIAEIIQMSEKRLRLASLGSASVSIQNEPSTSSSFSIFMDKATVENETSFSTNVNNATSSSTIGGMTPTSLSAASKAEKKVTFARLLDKLTAHDMSSSSSCSDLSCAEDSTRTITVNPKPPKKDRKGRLKRSKAWSRGRNSETDQDGFEMSSSDTTPDPICPPRFPSRVCVSPTGLSVSANNSPSFKPTGKSLPKMASADSLLALFRRFSGSGSAPPSPQYSENEESSAGATPLSTPSSPRNSALSLNIRPPAFLITTPEGSVDASTSPGHDPFGSQGGGQGSWRSQAQNMNVISLEVPMREHCLSPIHEVPTPLPTPSHSPAHSPMMHRPKQEQESSPHSQGLPMIKLQPSSDVEDEETANERSKKFEKKFPMLIPKISISEEGEDCMIMLTDTDQPTFDECDRRWTKGQETIPDVLLHGPSDPSPQTYYTEGKRFSFDEDDMSRVERRATTCSSPTRSKGRPPPLIFANEIMSEPKTLPFKDETDSTTDRTLPIISGPIPIVNIQDPTPTATPAMTPIQEECSIPKTVPIPPDITAFAVMVSPKPWEIQSMRQITHAPLLPPMIMINQNSEPESDSDSTIRKLIRKPNLSFLSPFVGTSDRVPSESNLSTSGYSSMASPCPSRCPSVSPLCPDMMDEYHGGSGHHHLFRRSSLVTPGSSRKSSLTLTPRRCSLNATSPLVSFASNLLGMGSTGAISSFGESMELLQIEVEADSALETETGTEPEKKDENENPEVAEEFNTISLLQVPRKNLPKSRSLDIPERDSAGGQRSSQSETQSRGNQPIRKGDSLDSKLNSFSGGGLNNTGFPALVFQSALNKSKSGSIGGSAETKRLSPVSSRSDSSMSELSVIGLIGGFTSPITDSDGVYDCGSSEVQSGTGGTSRDLRKSYANTLYLSPSQQIRRSGRRKNRRKMSGGSKKMPSSPIATVLPGYVNLEEKSKGQGHDLDTTDVVSRLSSLLRPTLLKKTPTSSTSPKRRVRAQTNLDVTSSSSESLNSLRSSRSRISSGAGSPKSTKSFEQKSPEKVMEEIVNKTEQSPEKSPVTTLPIQSPCSEGARSSRDRNISQVPRSRHRNISRSRLRTISLQIKFLRRLERNLIRKREKLNSRSSVQRSQNGSDSSQSCCSSCTCSSLCTTSCSSSSSSSSSEDESRDEGERSRLMSKSTK